MSGLNVYTRNQFKHIKDDMGWFFRGIEVIKEVAKIFDNLSKEGTRNLSIFRQAKARNYSLRGNDIGSSFFDKRGKKSQRNFLASEKSETQVSSYTTNKLFRSFSSEFSGIWKSIGIPLGKFLLERFVLQSHSGIPSGSDSTALRPRKFKLYDAFKCVVPGNLGISRNYSRFISSVRNAWSLRENTNRTEALRGIDTMVSSGWGNTSPSYFGSSRGRNIKQMVGTAQEAIMPLSRGSYRRLPVKGSNHVNNIAVNAAPGVGSFRHSRGQLQAILNRAATNGLRWT